MNRRQFLIGAAALAPLGGAPGQEAGRFSTLFTPCINQATTAEAAFPTALDAYAKAGFRAIELWLASLEGFLAKESPAVAKRAMADHGIVPVSSCCQGDLFFPRVRDREKKLDEFKRKLETSAALGAPRFVMYSAVFEPVTRADYDAALPHLHELGELARQFGIRLGIEFIRGAKFLGCLETTSNLLRKIAHPSLGVLVDTFHFYAGTSKFEDFENLERGEISFVHIDDVPPLPRELLEDKHRVFLGEGVMPLGKILRAVARIYQGPISFEVFQYAKGDPYQVAKKSFEGLSRLLGQS